MFSQRSLQFAWFVVALLWARPGFGAAAVPLDETLRIQVFTRSTRNCLRRFSPRRPPTLASVVRTRKTIWIDDLGCSEKNLAEIDAFLRMQYHLTLFMTDAELRAHERASAAGEALPPLREPGPGSWVDRGEVSFRTIARMERGHAVHKIQEVYRITDRDLASMPKSVAEEIQRLASRFGIRIFRETGERVAFLEGRLDPDRQPLAELGLPRRCLRILNRADLFNVDELVDAVREGRFASLAGFGRECRARLESALVELGRDLPPPDRRSLDEVDLPPSLRWALDEAAILDVPTLRASYVGGRLTHLLGADEEGWRAIDRALDVDLPGLRPAEKVMLVRRGLRTSERVARLTVGEADRFGVREVATRMVRARFGRELYVDALDRDLAERRPRRPLKLAPLLRIHLEWDFRIRTVGDLVAAVVAGKAGLAKVLDYYEPDLRPRLEKRIADCAFGLEHEGEEE